jgi:WS/DGAT/MGAT family acyltransferase
VPTILDLLSDRPTAPPEPKDAPGTLAGFVPGTPVATLRGVAGWVVLPARLAGTGLRTLRYLWGRRKDDGLLLALPSFVGRMLPGWAAPVVTRPVNALRRRSGRPEVLPLMPKGPMNPTPFNGRITSRRTYAFSDLPLADFKAAGKAFDASLNDAVVAVCAGAVRRFLVDHGAPTGRPLVVCIPATLRTGDEKQRWANHVSMFFAEFPTHLSDPAARIEALHSDLEQAKDNFDAGPTTMIRDVMGYLPETFWDVSVKLMAHGPDWIPGAPWNVVVSNVRGPAQTISMYGLELAGYWPVAFLTPGIGLNITLQSYRDRMDFGFIGCPDLTPDLWDFPTYMAQSLAELQAAAAARTGDVPSISPPRKAATRAPRPRPATSAGRVRGTSAARARPPTAAPAADG